MLQRKRSNQNSRLQCLISIVSLHAETINIWSHLLSTIWFTLRTALFVNNHAFSSPGIAIVLYLLGAVFCFWCSTMYHIFSDHPHALFWEFLDHLGILTFIWSSAVSFAFFSFQNQADLQERYILLANLATTLYLGKLLWIQFYHLKKRRSRVILHGCFGGLALIPSIHCWCLSSVQDLHVKLLRPYWTLALTNTIGGGIYATNLLDQSIGTLFEVPGVSHNVMHVAVFIGALTYECGLLSMI